MVTKGRFQSKPWGFEIIWAENEKYLGKLLHINAGKQLSLQYHTVKDETILVLEGALYLEVDGETKLLIKGDRYRIQPGVIHRMRAPTIEHALVAEVSTPEIDDVVRLSDDYGREGTSEA